jgi:ribonucleoside-diphosphate reductase alpha chain
MYVVKRDGSREEVKIEKILHAVSRACRGIENVVPLEVAKRTINGLHEGSTTEELDNLSIETAVMLTVEEPNYSKVAARMLAESIRKEAGRDEAFRDYIKLADELALIDPRVRTLAEEDLDTIEYAIDHDRDDLFEYFGLRTIYDRYLLRHPKTRRVIERPQWMFMRVALGLSKNITEAIEFYDIISNFLYMPSTPTLFNSGTRHAQMSSCYLLTIGEDSLEGIYKAYADCAQLSKWSGGIGIDWTPVRASGALIKGTNGKSNGIIPFLKVMDSSVHAVNQGGKRKGAAAVYLEPWHADIEAFLELRNNTGAEERRTHNLNLALWVPDLFMKRIEADAYWSLFSPNDVPELLNTFGDEFEMWYEKYEAEGKALKQVSARALYGRMMQTLAETGNGWLCFKDTSNKRSAQTGKPSNIIHSSNLCTEILEVTSKDETAVCNLGSINVGAFVRDDGYFDFNGLRKVVRIATKFLDRVIDINFYPTKEAEASNRRWRPVGLGLMGLQDVFFKMRMPFDSPDAKALSNQISEVIYFEALKTSVKLAEEFGAFPAFNETKYVDGKLAVHLAKDYGITPTLHEDWDTLAEEIKAKGLRNSLLIAIAPTATIASIVGCYECIEPQVSNLFKRETLSGEFLQINRYLVADLKRLGLWTPQIRAAIIEGEGSIQHIDAIPEDVRALYKTAWEISQKALIDMAAERSAFVCQSQSLNLFMESPTIGKLSSMYMYAWKRGLKTTYYLRSRAKTRIQKTTTAGAKESTPVQETAKLANAVANAQFTNSNGHASSENKAKDAVSCSLENPDSCEACQ